MRALKGIGLVLVGVAIGAGAMFWNDGAVEAQIPAARLTLNRGGVVWADSYGFRFVRDTRTATCYIASLKDGGVVAIAQAPIASCD